MARRKPARRAPRRGSLLVGRYFGVLAAILVGLYVTVVFAGPGSAFLTPKLGLDLEGGAQVILTPQTTNGKKPNAGDVSTAVSILRQRVNGAGVSSAEVTTQGNQIVVQVPKGNRASIASVTQTAELNFRQVLLLESTVPPSTTTPSTTTTTVPSTSPTGTAAPKASAAPRASAAPKASAPVRKRALSSGLLAAATPAPTPTANPLASGAPVPQTAASAVPSGSSTTPSNGSVASGAAYTGPQSGDVYTAAAFATLDCSNPAARAGGVPDQPGKIIMACESDGTAKYELDVAKVVGKDVKGANVGADQTTGAPQVNVQFTGSGQDKFTALTKVAYADLSTNPTMNRVAITLDGVVVSAPSINSVISGDAQISGGFTQQGAQDLANDLKYGALPLTLTAGDTEVISASLGKDQLHSGLLAGGIGLALVVVYSLIYYRVLGLVTISSLSVSAALVYGSVCLLGKELNLAVSLAGIAGFIVSVGITADSFVVYFERLKDEIKEGRTPRSAVDRAWVRARRTILSADTVSILAAVILYLVSVGDVRGFAFTLGLSTLLDIVVVFLFTRPLITLLSRYRWFSRSGPTGFFGPDGGQPSTGGPRKSLQAPSPPSLSNPAVVVREA